MKMTESISRAASPSHRARLRTTLLGVGIVLATSTTSTLGRDASFGSSPQDTLVAFSLGKVFMFLLLTLGPFNVVGPFVQMTRGRDATFKRRLAFQGILIAALAVLVATTLGVSMLTDWGVSAAALFIATGVLLFLVGMQLVVSQYKPRQFQPETSGADTSEAPSETALAFSPLAFPTIVTPYGIAVLVLAMTLASEGTASVLQILAIAVFVLALDLVAMLVADRILGAPLVIAAFGIVGSVMAVLQIALSVQAIIVGLRLLGVVSTSPT